MGPSLVLALANVRKRGWDSSTFHGTAVFQAENHSCSSSLNLFPFSNILPVVVGTTTSNDLPNSGYLCAIFALQTTVPRLELLLNPFSLCPFLQPCHTDAFLQGPSVLHVAMLNPIGIQVGTFHKNREGLWVVAGAVCCAKSTKEPLRPWRGKGRSGFGKAHCGGHLGRVGSHGQRRAGGAGLMPMSS